MIPSRKDSDGIRIASLLEFKPAFVTRMMRTGFLLFSLWRLAVLGADPWTAIEPLFTPPAEFRGASGNYKSLLRFENGQRVLSPDEWQRRRQEILRVWQDEIGTWPALMEKPRIEYLSSTTRETFTQHRLRMELAPNIQFEGYLLVPSGRGPFPGVVVPYYEPESSIGLGTVKLRDFAYQLTRRGFVSLAIGSPGGDARKPETSGATCQPLHFLGYVAANGYHLLASLPKVDAKRIGVAGHSYGGKWAMFAACFYEKFAAAAWSDPGIVFDEQRPNVNYWEPWYLGADPVVTRTPGLPTAANPSTGAYQRLIAQGRDLHEVQALMAPRPFLASGGAEDPPERWQALNRINEVYALLNATNRVAMSHRSKHDPTEESNQQIYSFFEHFLGTPVE